MSRLVYWLTGGILAWVLGLALLALVLSFANALTHMRVMV